MTARSGALLAVCAALFGLSFVLTRSAVGALGPVGVSAARAALGGCLLLAVVLARGERLRGPPPGRFLVLGALSAALPFLLLSLAMTTMNAGTAAVLNSVSPLFALAVEVAAGRDRFTALKLAGLATGAGGVTLVMAERGLDVGPGGWAGVLAGLAGAAVFAYGASYAARHFRDTPPLVVATGQQLGAAVLLLPLVAVFPPPGPVTPSVAAVVAGLGILGSGVAYLLFYRLIDRLGPARTATVNLLVPISGVLWGLVLLGEPISPPSVLGMAAILVGLRWVLMRP
ncbi:DMT family transporter [Streptosporangium sp. NPDC048865]|uniref:DMT family transporter n=1 Tax=Streptosporangium sp. NPDC048865 TaxID=3155766 RepID=UPI0034189728